MSFQSTYRTFAVLPAALDTVFPTLLATYGEDLEDGPNVVRTIGAHWDDTAHTRKRAASFPTTITGIPLTNGRLAFTALWQSDLAAAFDAGSIPDIVELSPSELAALIPPSPSPAMP